MLLTDIQPTTVAFFKKVCSCEPSRHFSTFTTLSYQNSSKHGKREKWKCREKLVLCKPGRLVFNQQQTAFDAIPDQQGYPTKHT
eukprot:m.155637 g.155637  ORF g.155637 m.155637 type:complete len:84 (+) comp24660_c0_seq2:971-1222(+)